VSAVDPGPPLAVDAVVVAAGSSRRMAGIDKLAAPVAGRPVLAHALAGLAAVPLVDRIVVVTAPDRVDEVRTAVWLPPAVVAVVAGAARRQGSVAAGLAELDRLDAAAVAADPAGLPADRVVLIHDGARPVVDAGLVERVARAAARHGAAIPVLPVAETVKRVEGDRIVETIDRAPLATAQTPQAFRRSVLRAAYARRDPAGSEEWTDEAALCESCTIPVHVVPGDPANVKVTLPADLARVAAALGGPLPAVALRTGIGHDSHPFGPGEPLVLGGVAIAGAPRLHGHSDGDVALHALADALLGAAGLGDLGRLFPAGPATPRGIASAELVGEVVRRLEAAGLRVVGVDLTIVAARPRLAGHLEAMGDSIARLVGLPPAAVNVKASTGNLAGDEGAGRGASALAIATVGPR
jgi:2-C-methyl-D-erythritol 4-phosphate cytidylyltransferase/2-C-methyl-D-erythritol 2,4-cyclodiphosphate synthase